MTVTVRYLASLREAVGREVDTVNVDAGCDLPELLARIEALVGADAWPRLRAAGVRIALNRTLLVDEGARIAAGDELAFLPPVTGG